MLSASESLGPKLGASESLIKDGGAEGDKRLPSSETSSKWSRIQCAVLSRDVRYSRMASEEVVYSVMEEKNKVWEIRGSECELSAG